MPHKKHSKDGKPLHDWAVKTPTLEGCIDCPALRPRYGIEPTSTSTYRTLFVYSAKFGGGSRAGARFF